MCIHPDELGENSTEQKRQMPYLQVQSFIVSGVSFHVLGESGEDRGQGACNLDVADLNDV